MKKIDIHTGRETEDDNRYKRSIQYPGSHVVTVPKVLKNKPLQYYHL
jgi:hypothetical protein